MKKVSAVLIISFIVFSCKKNGSGGSAELTAYPQHHGKAIKGCTVYVKFGASDLPADPTNNYNLKIDGNSKEDHVHIKNLLYGKYYLYAVGYDSSIMAPVTGGIAAKIKYSQRKKETEINIAVTE